MVTIRTVLPLIVTVWPIRLWKPFSPTGLVRMSTFMPQRDGFSVTFDGKMNRRPPSSKNHLVLIEGRQTESYSNESSRDFRSYYRIWLSFCSLNGNPMRLQSDSKPHSKAVPYSIRNRESGGDSRAIYSNRDLVWHGLLVARAASQTPLMAGQVCPCQFRLFNRPTDQIWTPNLIGRFGSGHQSDLSDCGLDYLDYLDESIQNLHDDEDAQSMGQKQR
jgi:hypothetical protein